MTKKSDPWNSFFRLDLYLFEDGDWWRLRRALMLGQPVRMNATCISDVHLAVWASNQKLSSLLGLVKQRTHKVDGAGHNERLQLLCGGKVSGITNVDLDNDLAFALNNGVDDGARSVLEHVQRFSTNAYNTSAVGNLKGV